MIGHRCKDCTWFDTEHESINLIPKLLGKFAVGICRKHKPGAVQISNYFYGVQPVMDANELCGEFRKQE